STAAAATQIPLLLQFCTRDGAAPPLHRRRRGPFARAAFRSRESTYNKWPRRKYDENAVIGDFVPVLHGADAGTNRLAQYNRRQIGGPAAGRGDVQRGGAGGSGHVARSGIAGDQGQRRDQQGSGRREFIAIRAGTQSDAASVPVYIGRAAAEVQGDAGQVHGSPGQPASPQQHDGLTDVHGGGRGLGSGGGAGAPAGGGRSDRGCPQESGRSGESGGADAGTDRGNR